MLYGSSRLTCSTCLRVRRTKPTSEDCRKCGGYLLPENYDAWNLIEGFGDAFFNGTKPNIEGIKYAIETSDIPPEYHHITFQKILRFCVAAINATTKSSEEDGEQTSVEDFLKEMGARQG